MYQYCTAYLAMKGSTNTMAGNLIHPRVHYNKDYIKYSMKPILTSQYLNHYSGYLHKRELVLDQGIICGLCEIITCGADDASNHASPSSSSA